MKYEFTNLKDMKKLTIMKTLLKIVLAAIFLIPVLSFSQTYTSDRQIDLTRSGEKKVGYEKATLTFLKDKGEFSIKYDNLSKTQTFKISYLDKKDNGDHMQTMYTIEGDLNYGGLKLAEFYSPIIVGGTSFLLSFTIIGMNVNSGKVAYYTTFYVKKK